MIKIKRLRETTAALLLITYVWLVALPVQSTLWYKDYSPLFDQFTSLVWHVADGAAVLMGVWGVAAVLAGHGRWPRWPTVPLLGLAVLAAVGHWTARYDTAVVAMPLWRLAVALGVYAFVARRPWPAWVLGVALGGFMAVQGGMATAQFLLQRSMGWPWLGELPLAAEPGYSIIIGQHANWLRGYGLTPHPNILGGLLGSAVVVWWGLAMGRGRLTVRPVSIVLQFLALLGVLFTFSRSAWLGLGVAAVLLAVVWAGRWRQMWRMWAGWGAAVLLAGAFFLAVAWLPLTSRFVPEPGEEVTQSIGERQLLRGLAWQMIGENGPVGMGVGNFVLGLLPLRDEVVIPVLHPVHHVPLLATAELGWLGGALWLVVMLFPPFHALWAWWHGRLSPTAAGLAAALTLLACVDLLDYYSWGWPQGVAWRWLLWGLWAGEAGD